MRKLFFATLAAFIVLPVLPAEWTPAADVRHDEKVVMTYRAKWDGEFLVVRAAIEPGWHTFVMDNKQRQQEKLKGKPSLGIEKSTEIAVEGLTLTGPWMQSEPKDFSKPELRWYSWDRARSDVRRAGKARRLRTCEGCGDGSGLRSRDLQEYQVTLNVPAAKRKTAGASDVNMKSLTPVR